MKAKFNKNIVYPVAFAMIAAGAFFYRYFSLGINDDPIVISSATSLGPVSTELSEDSASSMSDTADLAHVISVYICGAVNVPGVYEVSQGAIINDVLQLAGGFAENADRNNINLVYILDQNVTVYIPAVGEENYPEGAYLLRYATSDTPDNQNVSSSLININTASAEQLTSLPGIGESLASAIIDYRETVGLFANIEGLMNVSGIGQSKFDRIRELICV